MAIYFEVSLLLNHHKPLRKYTRFIITTIDLPVMSRVLELRKPDET